MIEAARKIGGHFYINAISRYDPTRTLILRRAFVADMMMRFNRIKSDIRESIVDNDCFGLTRTPVVLEAAKVGQFDFPRSSDKIDAFMEWLEEQEQQSILEVSTKPEVALGIGVAWTDKYIQTAYQKGIIRGRQELRKAGYDVPSFDQTFGGMSAVFNQPFHIDRVGILYTRTFSELKGITAEMDQEISRVLAQGIAEGRNPRQLARWINSRIEMPRITVKIPGIGFRRLTAKQRARTLARTEVIRAHHQATIAEYRSFAVEGVTVKAEWLTAGFNVCPYCEDMERGGPYTLDEIEPMIPAHPNCRCVAIPA